MLFLRFVFSPDLFVYLFLWNGKASGYRRFSSFPLFVSLFLCSSCTITLIILSVNKIHNLFCESFAIPTVHASILRNPFTFGLCLNIGFYLNCSVNINHFFPAIIPYISGILSRNSPHSRRFCASSAKSNSL